MRRRRDEIEETLLKMFLRFTKNCSWESIPWLQQAHSSFEVEHTSFISIAIWKVKKCVYTHYTYYIVRNNHSFYIPAFPAVFALNTIETPGEAIAQKSKSPFLREPIWLQKWIRNTKSFFLLRKVPTFHTTGRKDKRIWVGKQNHSGPPEHSIDM